MSFDYSTFLIYLGVILMCVGFWYILYGKFAEQDHKIETMCELVHTMAQDLQMIKMQNAVDKIQHTLNMNASPQQAPSSVAPSTEHITIDISGGESCYVGSNTCSIPTKIVVSDDDDTEFDTDEEREDVNEDDSIQSSESSEESSDDEQSVDYDDEAVVEVEQNDETRSEVSIDDELGESETKHIEVDLSLDNHLEEKEEPHIVVNKLQTRASPSPVPFILEPLLDNVEESLPEMGLFVPIEDSIPHDHEHHHDHGKHSEHSSNEEVDISNGDYSRLNVTQLRKLVTDRGLSTHATKLKKTELLSLLSQSSKSDGVHHETGVIDISM